MTSVCIFGSAARKRADRFSDKDVLIVGRSSSDILSIAPEWSSSGWSISSFTHQHMRDMASRGSLFLQHLKLEGIVTRDDDDFLSSIFSDFSPLPKYPREASESIELINDLVPFQPTYWSMLCSADIAYGAVRNIAILQLASNGVYLFDYSDLIHRFAKGKDLSRRKLLALLELRSLKHGYRSRAENLCPGDVLQDAIEGAAQLFGLPHGCKTPVGMYSGYRGLRLLELYLVANATPQELDHLPPFDPLAATWALIRNPRGYRPKPRLADEAWVRRQYELAQQRFTGTLS